jgi:hypothetical protein
VIGPRRTAWIGAKLFAWPAARATGAIAAGVLVVALLAGAIRVMPLMLAPGVPAGLAPVLGRGVAAVALEVALFVAPPIGWAIAASRLVDRGEARALFAAGISPWRAVARSAPAMLLVLVAAASAAGLWGREARAPGRALRDLLDSAREACAKAAPPAAASVPLLGVSWICLQGEPPRAVGAAPVRPAGLDAAARDGVFAARELSISDDLGSLEARDLVLVLPGAAGGAEARIQVGSASIRGLSPIARASNLSPAARALLLSLSAAALASLAAGLVLRGAVHGRVAGAAIGASGPLAALLVLSTLERTPSHLSSYLAVPAAGLAAIAVAAALARRVKP